MFISGLINTPATSYFGDWYKQLLGLKAPIIGIQRHRLTSDGEGVTTLVGFYGCPLSCKHCLNPHCKDNTYSKMKISPEELYQFVKVDDLYFEATGGGVTFGGGEPLYYPDFINSFYKLCTNDGWRLRVETSLNVERESVQKVYTSIHEFIVDIKDMNPKSYKEYTGKDNSLVKDNLRLLVSSGKADKVIVRIPLIEGYNTEEDIQKSKDELLAMGLHRFEILKYETSTTEATTETASGKSICQVLKDIRKAVADANSIDYEPAECHFEGDCPGTCPKCEEELKMLTEQLQSRKKNGTFREIPKQKLSPIESFIRKTIAPDLGGLICEE